MIRRVLLAALMLAMVAGLLSLGIWQLHRRVWKLALIERVDRGLARPPIPAPGPPAWPAINKDDAYAHVEARGTFRNDRETLVQAVTGLGAGYWVMTPLVTDRGFVVLVNRGFVPLDRRNATSRKAPSGRVAVTGLLRISEPGGAFLRNNDPGAGRWYSRDVGAIAVSRRLGNVAPYFIDTDAHTEPGWPRGGLTVIRFPNNHLVYALTWFAMAALLLFATIRMARRRPDQ